MKALSVRQPWASLITIGRKTLELRTWQTSYRGPLLICAGARPDPRGAHIQSWVHLGAAEAIVELVDIRSATDADEDAACFRPSDFAPECYAWVLANPRPVKVFPVKGQLGLFEVTLPKVSRRRRAA